LVSATRHPEDLLRLLRDTPVDMDQWFRWREVLRGDAEGTLVRARIRDPVHEPHQPLGNLKGGVIGGLAQEGDYKLDARLDKAA
jgi:DNA adenine methylase